MESLEQAAINAADKITPELRRDVAKMLQHYGSVLDDVVLLMKDTHFERFLASAPESPREREAAYYSATAVAEFMEFLRAVADDTPKVASYVWNV